MRITGRRTQSGVSNHGLLAESLLGINISNLRAGAGYVAAPGRHPGAAFFIPSAGAADQR